MEKLPSFVVRGWAGLHRLGPVMIVAAFLALPGATRADEPPPLIGEMARPRVLLPAGDGPMCQSLADTAGDSVLPDRMGVLLMATASEAEQRFVERALNACEALRGPVRLVADPFQVLALLRLERDLGVPESARGLLVGAWCVETAMKAKPAVGPRFLGDYREGVALASGSFQLHENVWAVTCGGTRQAPHDLLWAAGCWWYQVLKTEEKARRVSGCPPEDMLRVAEAAAANVRRYGFRCKSKSEHWQMMEAMSERRTAAGR